MAISPSFHRFRLFTSFIGLLDLKLGCTIFTLFNLFNKSAGVFGLLAIFQGGNLAQLSLYAYSLGTIFFSLWGLRGISEESSPTVMLYAHLYLADHMISSIWSFYFFQMIYYHTEHNGQPPTLSRYQSGLITLIESIESQYETKGVYHTPLEGSARTQAAQQVWKGESGFSGTVLILAWLLKVSSCAVVNALGPSGPAVTLNPAHLGIYGIADLLCSTALLLRAASPTWNLPFSAALQAFARFGGGESQWLSVGPFQHKRRAWHLFAWRTVLGSFTSAIVGARFVRLER